MGKGKRVKAERKRQAVNEKLLHPFLQNYPDVEDVPNYLRRMSIPTKSDEMLADDQQWTTLSSNRYECSDPAIYRNGIIAAAVNEKFRVFAIPISIRTLTYGFGAAVDSYDEKGRTLVKGASKEFAANKTKTIHLGTLKFYQNIKSDISSQRDPNEGRIRMGKDVVLEVKVSKPKDRLPAFHEMLGIQDPKSEDWQSLPHEGMTINYDGYGYIYSCSNFENGVIDRPEYDSYTSFNASPQRIAFALGMDVGSHLLKEEKGVEFQSLPEVRVFFGEVEYMDHEDQTILYRKAAVLNNFREDLIAIFTKTRDYSHQKEFRFLVTLDNLQWDYESNPSLTVAMSPNFQCHFGYTYWASEHEQH